MISRATLKLIVTMLLCDCRATVVESYTTFWTDIRSAEITEEFSSDGKGDENVLQPKAVSTTFHCFVNTAAVYSN